MIEIDLFSIWVPIILSIFTLTAPWFFVEDKSNGYRVDITPLFWLFGSIILTLVIWLVWALAT